MKDRRATDGVITALMDIGFKDALALNEPLVWIGVNVGTMTKAIFEVLAFDGCGYKASTIYG